MAGLLPRNSRSSRSNYSNRCSLKVTSGQGPQLAAKVPPCTRIKHSSRWKCPKDHGNTDMGYGEPEMVGTKPTRGSLCNALLSQRLAYFRTLFAWLLRVLAVRAQNCSAGDGRIHRVWCVLALLVVRGLRVSDVPVVCIAPYEPTCSTARVAELRQDVTRPMRWS